MVRFMLAASTLLITGASSFVSVSAAPAADGGTSSFLIPVTKGHSGPSISARAVYERDISRVVTYNKPNRAALFPPGSQPEKRGSSGTVSNVDVAYIADIRICSDTYSLIVDTGSANTWAGAQSKKVPSTCGENIGKSFSIAYGSGEVSGDEFVGPVSFAGRTVHKQSFGSAATAKGFNGNVDGIVGFGPVVLTDNTVQGETTVPTFMNNLYTEKQIRTETLGVYFAPIRGSGTDDANGELTLGGVDHSRFLGPLSYFPITTVPQYKNYWGIDVSCVTFFPPASGSPTLATHLTAIVDTGTTLMLLPTSVYKAFLVAAGNGTTDPETGLARFSSKPKGALAFGFGKESFPLTPDQYLVPRAQYAYFGLANDYYYAWIADSGSDDDSDVNFLIGQKFLEHYYSVYDTTKSRIGFAPRT